MKLMNGKLFQNAFLTPTERRSKTKSLLCFVLALFAVFALFFLPFAFSNEKAYADIRDTNVTYNSVEKQIVVLDEKVCEITERITVTFENPGINVGLLKNISKVNRITRIVDGKEYVTTTISDFELLGVTMDGEEEFNFVEEDSEYYYINTGADGDYKVGTHVYEILYRYDMGEDFIGAFDDFTFDVMDYGYASDVESFSATITLPKKFLSGGQDISEILSFRTNEMEGMSFEDVNFSISGNTISCSLENLGSQTGLTMQLILPDGYFNTSYTPNPLYFVVLALCVIAVVAMVVLIVINRKGKVVVTTVEFYPPKDHSPLDVARAYRGRIKAKDFASLVIYWAGQGYVSIKNVDDDISITKLKDLPEVELQSELAKSKKLEKAYFDALFEKGETVDLSQTKIASSKVNKAVKALYDVEKAKLKTLKPLRIAIHVLSILPLFLFIIWNIVLGFSSAVMFFILLFPVVAILVAVYIPMPIGFKIVWCGLFGGLPLVALAMSMMSVYDTFGLLYVCLAIFVLGNFAVLLLKAFSEQEMKVRGKILGFKNFLVAAELDRLEALIEENPNYYFDILPFCYVFGITKKMEAKFASLKVSNPEFYGGKSATAFGIALSHSMMRVSVVNMARGSGISGGRSFGGGGFHGSSGGGGGGGGMHGR